MTTRIITLFDRAPVEIDEAEWPTIASAFDHDGGEHEIQANRRWTIKIREHREEDRRLVYGVYTSSFPAEDDSRGGVLLDTTREGDTIAAVWEVIDRLGFNHKLGEWLIADLPAVRI